MVQTHRTRVEDRIGRAIDVVVAAAMLAFFAPLFVTVGFLVFLEDGGPAIFAQERIGRHGKRFKCFKFRSMAVDAEDWLKELLQDSPAMRAEWDVGRKLRHDPRQTLIGRFLRRSSIDELPQLLNILRGDMSLVGPRPIVGEEIDRYGVHFRHYCLVRPGLTGLWQVSGRSDLTYHERVVMDVAYVRSKCLTLDLTILFKTLPAVFLQRGSY